VTEADLPRVIAALAGDPQPVPDDDDVVPE
jgi:hypothetical protein